MAPLPRKVVPNGGEVVLRLRTAAKITGEVVRLDGAPATNATVRLERERLMWTAATDECGHFEIHVPAGDRRPWTLTATLRVGRIQLQGTRKGIRAGDSGVRIELEADR